MPLVASSCGSFAKFGILAEFLQRRDAHQIAARRFHAFQIGLMPVLIDHVLVLRHREIIFLAGLFDFQPGGNPRRRGSANEIRVEARPRPHASRAPASVAQDAASRELSAWPGTITTPAFVSCPASCSFT